MMAGLGGADARIDADKQHADPGAIRSRSGGIAASGKAITPYPAKEARAAEHPKRFARMMSRVSRCTKGLGVALLALGSEREGADKKWHGEHNRCLSISVRQNARLLVIDRFGENRLGQLKAPHFRCRCGSALFCPGPDLSARRVCIGRLQCRQQRSLQYCNLLLSVTGQSFRQAS